jgi:dienelactone hydrolase
MTQRALLRAVTGTVIAALAAAPLQPAAGSSGGASAPDAASSFAVGLRVLRLIDSSRTIKLPGGRVVPRTLLTVLRYPAMGSPGQTDVSGAPAARGAGPFPLVVFGHGFAVTPAIYSRLLQSWARAGYVVAAPLFPLENATAPGGPDESDLINQPRDMSYVITSLLAESAAATGPLAGLVDPAHIAVAGQSDGGETALAAAYSRRFRDPRVGAAVILSGARMSGVGGYSFTRGSPPLLAAQGTADTINEPRNTYQFFVRASRPKYLLRLLGSEHLPPYTAAQPQLGIVERVSIAFLDGYMKTAPAALQQLLSLGNAAGAAQLQAEP